MNLQEIKMQVIENVGYKSKVGDARLTRLINRAVEFVTNLVEVQYKSYNMATTPIAVSVVSGTKEYLIADYSAGVKIRKIVKIERTDGTTDPIDVAIIDFRRKNTLSGWGNSVHAQLSGVGARPIVYIRRDNIGDWYLGFPSDPGATMSLNVFYAPMITALSANTSVPNTVPEQHHDLIATRATVTLMIQTKEDPAFWRGREIELQAIMVTDLSSWNRTGPWRRKRGAAVG